MDAGQSQAVTLPAVLRPAQLAIIWRGRVILGDVTATLVDLTERGFLGIDEVQGNTGPDWLLTDLRDQAAGRSPLLGFEVTLLDGLFARQPLMRLSELGQALIPTLNRVRAQLRRDAIRHGRLRRWPRGQRSPHGEQLLEQIQGFRRELRVLAASGDSQALAGLMPYAMIFGIGKPATIRLDEPQDAGGAQRRGAGASWSQSDGFVSSWQAACAHASGDRHGDFLQRWSAPHDHGHGGGGHNSGHSGYGDHSGGFHVDGHSGL